MIIRHDKMNEEDGSGGGGAAAPVAAADASVIANAAEAVAQAKAAVAQAEVQKAALEQRLAALEAKPAAPPVAAVAPEDLEEVRRFMARERNDRRLETVKRMGLAVPLSDAQILTLAPDVDPREPDGLAKIEQWRTANAGMFKQQGQTQQSVVEALKPQLEEMGKKSGLFDAGKLTRSIFGGS